MSLTYFLKIDGVNGDVTTEGFEKWIAVDGYDIGVTTPVSSGAGGGATGRAQFSPLTVDIHSLTGLAMLFGDELQNRTIKSVELVGVRSAEDKVQTVYDLKLSNVLVAGFENDPGAQGVETELAFHFNKISLTDRPQNADGSLGAAQTFTFNGVSNKAAAAAAVSSDLTAVAASDLALSGGPAAHAATAVPAASPLHYFLKVDGVNGDVTTEGFEKWFAVDGYDIGVTTPVSSAAGGGATGRAQFSPLTVDIHSLTGLATLFGDELQNRTIKSVELVGVRSSEDKVQTVYDLKLSNVQISSFENDPGPQGVETELAFHFNKISLTDRPQNADGSLGAAQTFTFNGVSNTAAAVVSSHAATAVPAASPLHYFLKVDGVNGDVTTEGFEKWIAVDGYDIGVTTPVSSAAGGGATGRAQFSPLTVDIHSLTGLATLFGDELQNRTIKSVELVGVRSSEDKVQTVYDIKLSNVQISSFENDPGPLGVETELAFHFNKISLTDRPQNADGSLGAAQTFTFNGVSNKAAAAVSSDLALSGGPAAHAATAVPAASPLHYFLKVDGVNGDVTTEGFEKWIAVDGYDIGVTTPVSSAAGGGATGRAQFSPLTVDIHSLTGLATLFGDELQNRTIKSVELVGVRSSEDKTQTVYDLKLSNVLVAGFENNPGPQGVETELTFHFNKISLTDHPLNGDGSLGAAQAFTFDSGANKAALLANFMAASDFGSASPTFRSLAHHDNDWLK